MFTFTIPPTQEACGGVEYKLTITLVFGKMDNGKWTFDCVESQGENECKFGEQFAKIFCDGGDFDNLERLLDGMTDKGNKECQENNKAIVRYFKDLITNENRLTVYFEKERASEEERDRYISIKRRRKRKQRKMKNTLD